MTVICTCFQIKCYHCLFVQYWLCYNDSHVSVLILDCSFSNRCRDIGLPLSVTRYQNNRKTFPLKPDSISDSIPIMGLSEKKNCFIFLFISLSSFYKAACSVLSLIAESLIPSRFITRGAGGCEPRQRSNRVSPPVPGGPRAKIIRCTV